MALFPQRSQEQPCSQGSCLHISMRGTEFADKNIYKVMLGMEQAGSSC